MACTYTLKGKGVTYNNYVDLINDLEGCDPSQLLDFLFSQGDRQGMVHDSIMKLSKEQELVTKSQNPIDGSPDFAHEEGVFTTQTFIDSNYFMIDGERPIFQMNMQDYVDTMKKNLVASREMSQEGADLWGNRVQSRWETISENASDFHKLILQDSRAGYSTWSARTAKTAFAGVTDKVIQAQQEIIKKIMYTNGTDANGNKGILNKNLNIEAELKDRVEKIIGHIDFLVVKPDGSIEIYNVKTSTEPVSQWAAAKMEKYRCQMALLKQMLAFHGIDSRNIQLNIIPVQLKYDNNFEMIEDIRVQSPQTLDFKDGKYVFRKYDEIAANFIDSKANFSQVGHEALLKVSTQLQHIFPGRNIAAAGIQQSAKEWVDSNWNYIKKKKLDDGTWEFILPETKEKLIITDPRSRSNNEELVKHVQEQIEQENDMFTGDRGATYVRKEIANAFRVGFLKPRLEGKTLKHIQNQFSKYFQEYTTDADGNKHFNWSLIDSPVLDAANIIALRHNTTKQLDLFVLTNTNPSILHEVKGRENLLGYYLDSMNQYNFVMKGDYGNIEAVRAIALLNEIIPSIEGEVKLGQLKVVGLNTHNDKTGAYFECENLLREWDTIIRVVNQNSPANIENNFRKQDIQCIEGREVLRQVFADIMNDDSTSSLAELQDLEKYFTGKVDFDGATTVGLMDIDTTEGKVQKLEDLLDRLKDLAASKGIHIGNANAVLEASHDSFDHERQAVAKLYIAASQALNRYYGDISLTNEEFSGLQEYIMKYRSITNSNVRRVASLVQKSIVNILNNVREDYMENVFPLFEQYYKDSGYTKAQNAVIGNQVTVYNNLYKLNEEGVNTFLFKNPYDSAADLKPHEREFLKKILYELYKVKCQVMNKPCDITGINDEKLITDMPEKYLWVPLQKASVATNRYHFFEGVRQTYRKAVRMVTNTREAIEEVQDMIDSKDAQLRDQEIDSMRIYNPYTRSLINIQERERMIATRGAGYYETNLENIFADMLTKQVQCEEFNKLLIRIKGIELSLRIRGITESDQENIDHTIKAIDDFVSLNVYNKSIMEKTSQKINMWLAPLRRLVSTVYIAGNIMGLVRDTFQGIESNFLRAAIKFQTDINMEDVAFGYAQVMSEGVTNIMSMTKLNQFNIKYAFSNFDAAHINERLKTGRGGLLNVDNWFYWTLRAPDYLNRMVLFVAKLHHDGAFDAYSLNEKGRLVYDWRKDKRFKVLAANDTSNPEYNKQEALYMSKIREFNMQDTSKKLAYTDDLPDAYTPKEIQKIKAVGESIYGAYDLASRSKLENVMIGRQFAFFFTWMNGMVEDYWKGTQISEIDTREVQETDYNGNPLFWEEGMTGNITTRDTGRPVTKDVPITVQGVMATYKDAFINLYHGGWESLKNDVWNNPVRRANLKRSWSDLAMIALVTALFKLWITPAYKKHKQEDDGTQIFRNLTYELVYKGAMNSYDVFGGPIVLFEYFTENTNPTAFVLQKKILSDAWNVLSGQKDFGSVFMNSQAFLRSMKDSYQMYRKETSK